jgi:anaerobic selenocysteine-containing dehydrogenase
VAEPLGEARSEWRIFAELASRVRPDLVDRFAWSDNQALRREIGELVEMYAGIEQLSERRDQIQYGGRHLCRDGVFPLPGGRAKFSVVQVAPPDLGPDEFFCSTRRGKQFNSMVQRHVDPLTGAARDEVFISREDLARVGLAEGARVRLRSPGGSVVGRLKVAPMRPGNLEVHWPEGNALLGTGLDPDSMEPDYNALVTIERVIA